MAWHTQRSDSGASAGAQCCNSRVHLPNSEIQEDTGCATHLRHFHFRSNPFCNCSARIHGTRMFKLETFFPPYSRSIFKPRFFFCAATTGEIESFLERNAPPRPVVYTKKGTSLKKKKKEFICLGGETNMAIRVPILFPPSRGSVAVYK